MLHHGKRGLKCHQMGPGGDLADIFGDMDVYFDTCCAFVLWDFAFLNSQVPKLFCGRGWGVATRRAQASLFLDKGPHILGSPRACSRQFSARKKGPVVLEAPKVGMARSSMF